MPKTKYPPRFKVRLCKKNKYRHEMIRVHFGGVNTIERYIFMDAEWPRRVADDSLSYVKYIDRELTPERELWLRQNLIEQLKKIQVVYRMTGGNR